AAINFYMAFSIIGKEVCLTGIHSIADSTGAYTTPNGIAFRIDKFKGNGNFGGACLKVNGLRLFVRLDRSALSAGFCAVVFNRKGIVAAFIGKVNGIVAFRVSHDPAMISTVFIDNNGSV